MKKLKLEGKLMLTKEKIAQLGANQMNAIKGGNPPAHPPQGTITCSCLGTWVCQ